MEQKLGRGLSALFGSGSDEQNSVTNESRNTSLLDVDLINANKNQPRKFFDDEKILELSDSIKQHGVLQPLAVRRKGNEYEIIAGERRWRAAKLAGVSQVPVHIVECEDKDVMALALIENIQRSDLNPIEEAEAMKTLLANCNCTQEDLSLMVCKSRSYISNSIRLLNLPEKIKELIVSGKLAAGHGKILVGVENAEEIAETAASQAWNVRQLESAMKDIRSGKLTCEKKESKNNGTPLEVFEDTDVQEIANRISAALNVNAKLKITNKGGVLTLTCGSCESLERLMNNLMSIGE